MHDLNFEDLKIRVDSSHSELVRLDLTGKSNTREPGRVLTPYLNQVLEAASRTGAAVSVHFEQLEHFNSSTIAAVIQFINAAQSASVRVSLHYAPTLKWQLLSFDALRRALQPFAATAGTGVTFVEEAAR